MKATITDVAKRAGVSMKTVSRVLNNEPNVAQKTRERVMEVANELRYSPNLAARGLASSKSYLIALIYDNPSPYYIAKLQRGAIDACRKRGYHIVLEPIDLLEMEKSEDLSKACETFLERLHVDGVILSPPLSDSDEFIQVLKKRGVPYVLVAPSQDNGMTASVRMDDMAAAYELTEKLISQGHKKIGFIKGHPDHSATVSRLEGYRSALEKAGIHLDEALIVSGDFSFRSGVAAADILLGNDAKRPSAIFASNDDMAAGVISVAGRKGLNVPEDLAVCGFDDTPLARILWPQLTTVQQPIYEMGYGAAETLLSPKKDASEEMSKVYDFKLMIRGSTHQDID